MQMIFTKQKSIRLFFLLSIVLASCKKEVAKTAVSTIPQTFDEIFVDFWGKMNYQYVYWNIDDTDWNLIYKHYRPIFQKLNNTDEDKIKAMSYFEEITSTLKDGHFSLLFHEGPLSGVVINPSLNRKKKSVKYHSKYNYDDVVKNYLDPGYRSAKGSAVSKGELLSVTTGTINRGILYFHCNFFGLKNSYYSVSDSEVKETLNYFFSTIRETSNLRGIILDLRGNGGGDIEDLDFLVGKLVNQDLVFGYSRSKNGMGKFDYLPWIESRLRKEANYQMDTSVMLLVDNFSASLSEIIILALKSEKNLVIGEQTYGATGPISDPSIFNSGTFNVGTFLTVNTSAVEFKDKNGAFYEGVGISPDIGAPFNFQGLALRKDTQLEAAILQIK